MTDWKWTAWCQPTWRGERSQAALIMPLGASLSFDGKRWVSVDSLAERNEEEVIEKLTDEERAALQRRDVCYSPPIPLCEKALRIIDAQAAEIERIEAEAQVVNSEFDLREATIARVRALPRVTLSVDCAFNEDVVLDPEGQFVLHSSLLAALEPLDSLANEPQNGQPIRPPE